jgi:ABC-type taurine transport system substrate-binding protein
VVTASGDVQIGNLGSSPLAAAAGAFVWSPALARKDYAEKHPEVVARFAKVTLDSFADYATHKDSWTADSVPVQKIAKLTAANAVDVPELLAGWAAARPRRLARRRSS